MVKVNNKFKLQKRDWAIVVLFLALAGTHLVWYQYTQAQNLSHESHTQSWLNQQVQINKLKNCIDEGIKPCDISPYIQENGDVL